jgi:hypothetical protein
MKSKVFLFILSLSIIAYNAVWYQSLSGNYNASALVVTIDDITLSRVEKYKENTGAESVMVSYQRKHGSGVLYMQWGNLGDFETVELIAGNWALSEDRANIIIGDEIADAYYSQLTCINRTFVLGGVDYKVVGVVKDSDDIYIGFDEKQKDDYWGMKRLFILGPNKMNAEDYLDLLNYDLNQNLIKYSEITLVKWQMDIFKNIAWLTAISILLYFIASLVRKTFVTLRQISKHYMSKRNDTELIAILTPIWQEMVYVMIILLGLLVTVLVILFGVKSLHISANYLPQNLFSIESFYDLFKRHITGVLNGMRYGMDNLQILSIGAIMGQITMGLVMCTIYLLKFSWKEQR